MTKPCSTESTCIWSENNKFCEMLYKASVPLDDKWPQLILHLRSIGNDKFLGEGQKSQMQELLLRTLRDKNFSATRYNAIMEEMHSIVHAPYEDKLRQITREVNELTKEANGILGKHQQEIVSVADSMDSDLLKGTDTTAILSKLRDALRDVAQKMESDTSTLLQLSHKDWLTGLANRRSFDEFLAESVGNWEKTKEPVCLVLFDIDHFKKFNDKYGHLVGDQVLRTLAARVRRVVEPLNVNGSRILAARYGGEEFGIILNGNVAPNAPSIAESVRKAIADSSLLLRDANGTVVQSGLQVTVSLGVASLWDGWMGAFQVNLIDSADKALYKAKNSGRNCTVEFLPEIQKNSYRMVTEK